MLVDLEPKPMACPMKESNSPAFADLRRKTTLCEEFLNCLVNRHPIRAGLDLFQSQRLPGFHRFPKSSLRFARAPAQHSASHVTEVAGLRVSWKNIENDQGVRVQRTEPALVRIAPLIAAGNDRPGRNATGTQNRGINFCPEHLRGQRFAAPA